MDVDDPEQVFVVKRGSTMSILLGSWRKRFSTGVLTVGGMMILFGILNGLRAAEVLVILITTIIIWIGGLYVVFRR
jgi:hypothetical protein